MSEDFHIKNILNNYQGVDAQKIVSKFLESTRIMLIQGVDFSYLRENFMEIGIDETKFTTEIIEFIINAIKRN